MAELLNNLNIETATEEEVAEGLVEALRTEGVEDEGSKRDDGGGGTLTALEALEFLTQEAESSGALLVDARNGFIERSFARLSFLSENLKGSQCL